MSDNKKIKYLYCGGSFQKVNLTDVEIIKSDQELSRYISAHPEISLSVDLSYSYLYLDINDLTAFYSQLKSNYNDYDAVVISVDLNHVLFLANLTYFLYQNPIKPIIFTTSLLSENFNWSLIEQNKELKKYGGAGLKANLMNSLQVASLNIPAVGLFCGDRLLKPTQTERIKNLALNIFDAPNSGILARIDFGVSLIDKNIQQLAQVISDFRKVEYIVLSQVEHLDASINQPVFLDCSLNSNQILALDKMLAQANVPVVLWQPFYTYQLDLNNLVIATNFTKTSALAKFIYGLVGGWDKNKFQQLFIQDLSNELVIK